MKRWLVAVLSACIVLAGAFLLHRQERSATELDWRPLTTGGFRILMPAPPVDRDDSQNMGGLHFVVKTWYVDSRVGQFAAASFQLPVVEPDPEGYLEMLVNELPRVRSGRLLAAKRLTMGGFPGREVVYEYEDAETGAVVHACRIYLGRNRHYQAGVTTAKATAQASFVTKFLESFEIVDD